MINLSDCEKKLLARGPSYCVLKSVKEEGFCCCLEEAIVKHKWETIDDDEEGKVENGDFPESEVISDEEMKEMERLRLLAEEMAAESRTSYDSKNNKFNMNKQKVTDFKKNSRVILPRAQSGEKESKLEVARVELLEEHRIWVKTHCNCRTEQLLNLSREEMEGFEIETETC